MSLKLYPQPGSDDQGDLVGNATLVGSTGSREVRIIYPPHETAIASAPLADNQQSKLSALIPSKTINNANTSCLCFSLCDADVTSPVILNERANTLLQFHRMETKQHKVAILNFRTST